jgi:hypothetical protein
MDENFKAIESLLEKAADYGKTGLELARLRSAGKITDVVSTVIPHAMVLMLLVSTLLFLNLGLAFWLGTILGKTFYGLLIVAGFNAFCAFILHFFMHKWFKKIFGNYFVKILLK